MSSSEQERRQWEAQREKQIKARNLEGRMRAADPVQRTRIDPAIGRTFGDAARRGMYDDKTSLRSFRDMNDRGRRDRRLVRLAEVRAQGRQGRN